MGGTFLLLSLLPLLLHQVPFLSYSPSPLIFQEVRAEEQMVLASEALSSFMKAYLTHYRRQQEGLEMEGDDGSEGQEKRSKDGDSKTLMEDDDEGFLDYYYDIGTSEETMPNVNWTMLKPR